MECVLAFIILLFIAVLASGLGLGGHPRLRNRAYINLARRFNGNYQGGNIFRRPCVRFRYGGSWVTVSPGPTQGEFRTTEVRLPWGDLETELRVTSAVDGTYSPVDGSHIAAGDGQFERRYHVTGAPRYRVQRVLSDGVKWRINRLCYAFQCPGLHVHIHRGKMIIEKPLRLRGGDDLEEFTRFCLELFDQAMLTQCDGIEFMDSTLDAQLVEAPICQICGEEIVNEMLFCYRCRTPHHLDCWQYTGCCSVYGCRETRYVIPAVARPAQQLPESDSESEG